MKDEGATPCPRLSLSAVLCRSAFRAASSR